MSIVIRAPADRETRMSLARLVEKMGYTAFHPWEKWERFIDESDTFVKLYPNNKWFTILTATANMHTSEYIIVRPNVMTEELWLAHSLGMNIFENSDFFQKKEIEDE